MTHFLCRKMAQSAMGRAGLVLLATAALTNCATSKLPAAPASEGVTDRAIAGFDVVGGPDVAKVVWQDGYQFVRIDRASKAAETAIAAPSLDAGQVRRALGSVRLAKGGGDPGPAFDKDELDILAEPVARALSSLQPGQEIAFSVKYSAGFYAFGQKYITAGRIFPSAEGLDIIFGTVRAPYAGQLIATGVPPSINTGSRTERTQVDWVVRPDGFVSLPQPSRPDWARVAAEAWAPAAVPEPQPQPMVVAPAVPAVPPQASPAVPTTAAPAAVGTAPAVPRDLRDPQDIAKRIEVLDGLRKKGLITEEEYARHKTELLNRL